MSTPLKCYVERDEKGQICAVGDYRLPRKKGRKYTTEDRDAALTEYKEQLRAWFFKREEDEK